MTNGLRNHPGPGRRIRSYADEQRSNRRHRNFWIWYLVVMFVGLSVFAFLTGGAR